MSNIFETLGFDAEEAAGLRMRAQLMSAIRETIREDSLSQTQAAEAIGCTQPRVSDIVTGKLDRFTIDFLVSAATALGIRVGLVIESDMVA